MVWLRRSVQIAAFLVFLALLLQQAPWLESGFPDRGLAQLSPLAGLTASLAARRMLTLYLPALGLLAATLILGRFFCSWICPLGTTLDATDSLLARARRRLAWRLPAGRRLKYYLLAALVVAAIFGVQAAGWFDPLSIATRSVVLVVFPYADHLFRGVAGYLSDLPGLGGAMEAALRGWETMAVADPPSGFAYHGLVLAGLLAILLLGLAHRRLWCRALCPLGALLALVGQFSPVRRRVAPARCTRSRCCASTCNMGAVGDDTAATAAGECTLCLACRATCSTGAISFLPRRGAAPARTQAIDLSRRHLLLAGAAAVAAVPLLRIDAARRLGRGAPGVIRPPGAVEEDEFLARCVRCGQCLRVCRTNGLQLALLETGLAGMLTPRLVPRIGHCDWDCTLCGRSCPSGAIRVLTPPEKHRLAIGKARIDPGRCLPWAGYNRFGPDLTEWRDCNCAVCEEVCPAPTKAIRMSRFVGEISGRRVEIARPYVVEELCTGCGFCEQVCPLPGPAAVRVEPGRGTASAGEASPLMPAAVGEWRRAGEPEIYAGAERLWEYIDGAGDLYLTYGFVRVIVARYSSRAPGRVKIELWEFATGDGAFGAFSASRVGEPEPQLGWQANREGGSLWCWADHYYLAVEPEPEAQLTADGARGLAGAVLQNLRAAGRGAVPDIVAALPPAGLDAARVIYFRHAMPIQGVWFTDPPLALDILAIDGGARGALGEYPNGTDAPMRMLLIEYPDEARARRALDALAAGPDGVREWRDGGGSLHLAAAAGRRLAAVFAAPDSRTGQGLVRQALREPGT